MAKKIPEINASSMADIAFILLIFFLVATTMKVDKGVSIILPPFIPNQVDPPELNERDVLVVNVNRNDELLVEEEFIEISDLREKVLDFYTNPAQNERYPVKKVQNVPLIGDISVASKAVISLQNDVGTTYGTYLKIRDILEEAIFTLRNDLAKEKFDKEYIACTLEQQKAIRQVYKKNISVSEPKEYK